MQSGHGLRGPSRGHGPNSAGLSVSLHTPKGRNHDRNTVAHHAQHDQRRPAAAGRPAAERASDRQHRPDPAAQGPDCARHPHPAAAPGPGEGRVGLPGHPGARLRAAAALPHRYGSGVDDPGPLGVQGVPHPAAGGWLLPVRARRLGAHVLLPRGQHRGHHRPGLDRGRAGQLQRGRHLPLRLGRGRPSST